MAANRQLVEATRSKPPSAALDYSFIWNTEYAPSDTVTVSAWSSSPTGLTFTLSSIPGGTETSVRISGGIDGQDYIVSNAVTFASGQNDVKYLLLKVETPR